MSNGLPLDFIIDLPLDAWLTNLGIFYSKLSGQNLFVYSMTGKLHISPTNYFKFVH